MVQNTQIRGTKILFLYAEQFEEAVEKLNPEGIACKSVEIAKAFEKAYEIQLAVHCDKKIPYFKEFWKDNFEDLSLIHQTAWNGVKAAFTIFAERFEKVAKDMNLEDFEIEESDEVTMDVVCSMDKLYSEKQLKG